MRRIRRDGTKVWHSPELEELMQRRGGKSGAGPTRSAAGASSETRQHRAALEALFTPRREPAVADAKRAAEAGPAPAPSASEPQKAAGRIVSAPPPPTDPRTSERQRLLSRLLAAEGRASISKAANEFLRAGFAFPREQDTWLQLLEHHDEDHVRSAIDALTELLTLEPPRRRAVLESRLRRLEELADEEPTRSAARRLRRLVSGRTDATVPPAGSR